MKKIISHNPNNTLFINRLSAEIAIGKEFAKYEKAITLPCSFSEKELNIKGLTDICRNDEIGIQCFVAETEEEPILYGYLAEIPSVTAQKAQKAQEKLIKKYVEIAKEMGAKIEEKDDILRNLEEYPKLNEEMRDAFFDFCSNYFCPWGLLYEDFCYWDNLITKWIDN